MGFYGNITNTSKTQFYFDKIYSSRVAMDSAKDTDGIYAGRYVLIEYDLDYNLDNFILVQIKNDLFYYNPTGQVNSWTLLKKQDIGNPSIVYVIKEDGSHSFYKCISTLELGNEEPAEFKFITEDSALNINYTINYLFDKDTYGPSRGYDSTVWQKTYIDGVEKYIMIAELNTVVPTFDVSADAPTLNPIVPHFDTLSTDVYYKLHWQPSWGMRVKSSEQLSGPEFNNIGNAIENSNTNYSDSKILKSDEKTSWPRHSYNPTTGKAYTEYWNSELQQWQSEKYSDIPAAIYYNRAGFAPEYITIDETTQDEININPTGKSGNLYNKHDGTSDMTSYEDIQEVSMMLPTIGNSIAELWNIVYGNEQLNGGKNRNLDINWDSTNGLRLVNEDKENNGFTYEPDKMNTIAGAINSVHDLMGMIILNVSINPEDINNYSTDDWEEGKIYYNTLDSKYYIKYPHYIYSTDDLKNIPLDLGYNEFEIKELEDFPANTYYYTVLKNDENGNPITNYRKELNDYFDLNLTYVTNATQDQLDIFNEVELVDYYGKTYYNRNDDGDLIPYESKYDLSKSYYDIISIEEINGKPFNPNGYYSILGDRDGNLNVEPDEKLIESGFLKFVDVPVGYYNPEYKYYIPQKISDETSGESKVIYIPIQLFDTYRDDIYHINPHNFNDQTYYALNPQDNDKMLKHQEYEGVKYYIIKFNEISNFYIPNTFWIENDNEYSVSTNENYENRPYYTIDSISNVDKSRFYIKNVYYYLNEYQNYVIDTNIYKTPDRVYYVRRELYVLKDDNYLFTPGSLWNTQVLPPPKGVTLSIRYPVPRAKELNGFARTLNTIHGLLILLNRMLLAEDPLTRDRETVQGCINVLNDIINKIEAVKPGNIMIVDDYGRVHDSKYTTKQDNTIINYGKVRQGSLFNTVHEDAVEDKWLILDIDTNALEPEISLKHNFNPVANTETYANKNDNTTEGGNNFGNNDILNLYTPIVDGMGHIVGHNIEHVTLPYGYRFIDSNELNEDESKDLYTEFIMGTENKDAESFASLDDEVSLTVASNTTDRLHINTINKWIQTKVVNDVIELAHEVHAVKEVPMEHDLNGLVEQGYHQDKITVQDTEYDKAGHLITNRKHTYTLPFSYKTFKTNGRNNDEIKNNQDDVLPTETIASNTQDTINVDSGNYWMRVDITNDNIKLSHSVRDIDEESNGTSNLNTELNANNEENINIPDWEYDKAGHIIKKKSHTYTLPFGFKTIKTNGRNNENESENAISSPVIDDVVADHTQGILTLNSGNKWIRIDTDKNNDTLVFSHDIHDVNLDKEPGTTSLSNENSNEVRFVIPTDTYDKAGHFVSRLNETYVMPFGYGKIIGDEGNTVASATFDTLTLNTGDEWLTTKTTKDMVTFYHGYPAKIDDSISSLDMNKVDISNNEKNQITLETLVRDERGHVAKVNLHTVTLPYGYKTFQDSNADVGVSIADNTQDVFTFKGDSWVKPTVSKDLVTFEHIGPVSTSVTAKNNIVNPEFGSTFTIEDWHYDDKGHKNNLTTHTIQFPKGSLTAADSNGADVITQLSFVPKTGALTTSRTNINNLLLTDYIKLTDDSNISSTDTLGAALSKLLTQVIKEKNRINELNLLDSSVNNKYISAINLNNGLISVTRTDFPDFILRSEAENLINELKRLIKELTNRVNEIHPPEPEPEEDIL